MLWESLFLLSLNRSDRVTWGSLLFVSISVLNKSLYLSVSSLSLLMYLVSNASSLYVRVCVYHFLSCVSQ